MKYLKIVAGVAAALASAGANALVIDDFTTQSSDSVLYSGSPAALTLPSVVDHSETPTGGADILGGWRNTAVQMTGATTGFVTASGVVMDVGFGHLTYSNADGVNSWARVTWTGASAPITDMTSAPSQLMLGGGAGVNLLATNDTAIKVLTYHYDNPFTFWVTAWTSATQWTKIAITDLSNYDSMLHGGAPLVETIPFLAFSPAACGTGGVSPSGSVVLITCGGGGADVTHLRALDLVMDATGAVSTSLDLNIGPLSTVPEPGVLALMGASMLGIFGIRRRSKRVH